MRTVGSSTAIGSSTGRRKENKTGKIISLSVLGVALGVVVLLALFQLVSGITSEIGKQYNEVEMSITTSESDSDLRPMSPKIASESSPMGLSSTLVAADYAEVWRRLNALVPPSSSQAQREQAIHEFLDGLDYRAVGFEKEIVSKRTGEKINPATIMCYLNGYVPSKPHLKANCPA